MTITTQESHTENINIDQDIFSGHIKYFNEEKRYGYILGDDGREYYFNMKSVQPGSYAPLAHSKVSFIKSKTQKGNLAAISVNITNELVESKPKEKPRDKLENNDSRVTCLSCSRKIVPRSQHSNGGIIRTYCPYCLATYQDNDNDNDNDTVTAILLIAIVLFGLLVLFVSRH
jgi:cold shock CspA family protein